MGSPSAGRTTLHAGSGSEVAVVGAAPSPAAALFAERRERVLAHIGSDGLAVVRGAPAPGGFARFRQSNAFYYLTGAAVPFADLLIDGRRRRAVLYVRDAGAAAGTDLEVAAPERLAFHLARACERGPAPALWTPLAPAEGAVETRDTLMAAASAAASDPWDGRPSREAAFAAAVRLRFPQLPMHDLTPELDAMRLVKSPEEIAIMRRAARLTGEGALAAMRATATGVHEHVLEAEAARVFRAAGAQGEGYCAIVASGPNVWDAHYNRNDRAMNAEDAVLFDYAPDVDYYTSDIGRMWPVDGVYRPWLRELYGFMCAYHERLLAHIRAGALAADILARAAADMRPVFEATRFSKPVYAAAAERTLSFPGHLSHPVGLAVHDVGDYRRQPLVAGTVFALDPQMWVPEERLYVRVEDTVAVTADGVENLTGSVPRDPGAVERAMAVR